MGQFQDIFKKFIKQSWFKWTFIWVLATILSNLIGICLLDALPEEMRPIIGSIPGALIIGALWGAFVGFFQRQVLRIRAGNAVWWLPASTAGYALMLLGGILVGGIVNYHRIALLNALYNESHSLIYTLWHIIFTLWHFIYGDAYLTEIKIIIIYSFVFGLVLGITQWFVMRTLQPLSQGDNPLDEAASPQIPSHPRRIAAWWIPIHMLCTFLAGWLSLKACAGEMSVICFVIFYSTLSGIAFALLLRILLPLRSLN